MDNFWDNVFQGITVAIFILAIWVCYVFVGVMFSNTPNSSDTCTCICGEVCCYEEK